MTYRSQRALGRIDRMNGSKRRFNPAHPFWPEAVELRRAYHTYAAIADRAYTLGYDELTPEIVAHGLRTAPANLDLPLAGATHLRRKYESIIGDFSALDVNKTLILETLAEIDDLDQKLNDPPDDSTPDDIEILERRKETLTLRAFDWAKDVAKLQIQLEGLDVERDRPPQQQQPSINLHAWLDTVVHDFKQTISPPPPDELIEQFGADNISFPSLAPVDADRILDTAFSTDAESE